MNSSNPLNLIFIIITAWILYNFFWDTNDAQNLYTKIDSILQNFLNYKIKSDKEKFSSNNSNNVTNLKTNNSNQQNIKLDNIYGETGIDTSLYQKDTIYDKLVNIFNTKEKQFHDCDQAEPNLRFNQLEDWEKNLSMSIKLITTPLIVFNRESLPVVRQFKKIDSDNTLLPIAQSTVDILNEKTNKTSIITDIKDIEILTTEDQIQYTFYLFLNYPTINNKNIPIVKNIKIKVVLVKRRILKDDIFAPNRYDSSKFAITSMKLINYADINTIPKIKKGDHDYYSFKKLMTEKGEFTDEKYIDDEMIRNRRKHEHEMDFRNIIIEDDNYLNDYMNPDKIC